MSNKTAAPAPEDTVPAGYMKDAKGLLWPVDRVSELDMQRDAMVLELVNMARANAKALADFKAHTYASVAAFSGEALAKYGAKTGGAKGNITLHTFDGRFKLVVAIHDTISFGPELQAAKSLIDECITEWSEGARSEIKVLVQQAFQTDKEGNLNIARVMGLRKLDIKDERWVRAMGAIGDSVQVVGSKSYVRFYERVGNEDKYQAISLDMASL